MQPHFTITLSLTVYFPSFYICSMFWAAFIVGFYSFYLHWMLTTFRSLSATTNHTYTYTNKHTHHTCLDGSFAHKHPNNFQNNIKILLEFMTHFANKCAHKKRQTSKWFSSPISLYLHIYDRTVTWMLNICFSILNHPFHF